MGQQRNECAACSRRRRPVVYSTRNSRILVGCGHPYCDITVQYANRNTGGACEVLFKKYWRQPTAICEQLNNSPPAHSPHHLV